MSLRAKLTVAFAFFAAIPTLVALWPVNRALSEALGAEYAVRLDGAARAVEGEVRRLGGEAVEGAREVARSAEAETIARDREAGLLDAADAAGRAAEWMTARGLDVLALSDPSGVVISSGHLPGRAGDIDPVLKSLFVQAAPGRPVARFVPRATPGGVEPVLAVVAWEPVPAGDAPLRVAAGVAVGPAFAERLAALTGGSVAILGGDGGERTIASASRAGRMDTVREAVRRLLRTPEGRVRVVPIGGAGSVARIEISLPAGGLARAEVTVALAFLIALAAAVMAASILGHLLARRITRPVEALRGAALQVAAGDLDARVQLQPKGELGELVHAFNAMTADLAAITARAASAERVAAWREVARRLAHEIKNPLTPIAMSVETLRDAYEQGRPDFREIFVEGTAAIREEVRRLKRIVDEFSRFARLPRPELARVPAADLVSGLLALYPAPPPGVTLERDVAEDLGSVDVDRDQMLQVLLNVMGNAVEAIGGRGGAVRVSARRAAGEVFIAVSDDGPGIAASDLPRLFEPYFTTKPGGTGLGLAIAERIVREHGGRIEVSSASGTGTTFTVRLPAVAT